MWWKRSLVYVLHLAVPASLYFVWMAKQYWMFTFCNETNNETLEILFLVTRFLIEKEDPSTFLWSSGPIMLLLIKMENTSHIINSRHFRLQSVNRFTPHQPHCCCKAPWVFLKLPAGNPLPRYTARRYANVDAIRLWKHLQGHQSNPLSPLSHLLCFC